MHLLEAEMRRRAEGGLLASSLAEEARKLRQWLIDNHPNAAPPTTETIQNRIRDEYRQLKTDPTKL
jgi:hypothetical protein